MFCKQNDNPTVMRRWVFPCQGSSLLLPSSGSSASTPRPSTLTPKPTVTLGSTLLYPIKDPSSDAGKHCHQPSGVLLLWGPKHRNSQFSFPVRTGLRNASCHLDIEPVANAESRGERFWDLSQLMTHYQAARRERRAVSCKPFYAQFIPILCIVKKWFASYAVKIRMLSILQCLLVREEKSREKVKGLINLQFIFIVSRCYNLLVLRGRFSLSFAVAQIHCQH